MRPVFQGQGRRGAVERRSGLVSRGARYLADENVPMLLVSRRSHLALGVARSRESCVRVSGPGRMSEPSGKDGSQGPRRGKRTLQKGRNPGEHRPSVRGNSCRRERTRRRIKASKSRKLAEWDGSAARGPGRPGSVPSGA